MPRYQLYKSVLAGATGRVGEALSRQLLLSPLCSELRTFGRRDSRSFENLAAAKAKLRQHQANFVDADCGVTADVFEGADVAFCLLGSRSGWADAEAVAAVERDGVVRFAELCAAAKIPHMCVLSSAWTDKNSKMFAFAQKQAEAEEAIASMSAFERISIFRPSQLLDKEGVPFQRMDAPFWARGMWSSVPTVTQFLPMRFRPMSLDDVVLAMRLNSELCDASSRVERLDFLDMMQIIGREGDI